MYKAESRNLSCHFRVDLTGNVQDIFLADYARVACGIVNYEAECLDFVSSSKKFSKATNHKTKNVLGPEILFSWKTYHGMKIKKSVEET